MLEHLRGTSLEGIISKKRRLKTEQAVTIAGKLLAAVSAVHLRGRVLNCINPSNIFLSKNANGELDIDVIYIMIEGADTVLNDPEYLSPEQLSTDMSPDAAADLWAVSVMLYELAFGGHPFAGRSKEETLGRIMEEEIAIPPLLERTKPALAAVVRRALSNKPQKRYHRARDMITVLNGVLQGKHSPAAPSSVPAVPIPSVPAVPIPSVPAVPIPSVLAVPIPSVLAVPIPSGGESPRANDAPTSSGDDEITEERITLEVEEIRPSQIRALEKDALTDDGERPSTDDSQAQILNTPTVPAPVSSTPPDEACPSEPDLTERSIRSTELAKEERRHFGRLKPRRSWFVFGIGAVIASMISVGIWAYTRSMSYAPTLSEPTLPEAADKGSIAFPVSEKKPEEDNAVPSEEAMSAPKDMVTITVENLAADTGLKIGERWLDTSFNLRRSEEPVELTVIPHSKRSFTYRLVPSKDIVLNVDDLDNTLVNKPKKKKSRAGPKKPVPDRSRSGNLSSNPFRLKSNPFPTGE